MSPKTSSRAVMSAEPAAGVLTRPGSRRQGRRLARGVHQACLQPRLGAAHHLERRLPPTANSLTRWWGGAMHATASASTRRKAALKRKRGKGD
jgi:hypothetical protein